LGGGEKPVQKKPLAASVAHGPEGRDRGWTTYAFPLGEKKWGRRPEWGKAVKGVKPIERGR